MTQPPGPPNGPPYQPFQPGPGYQVPPPQRSRGPLLIVIGLLVLVVAIIGVGAVLLVTRSSNDKPAAKESPAVNTKPSDPKAIEFRRVLATKSGTCPTPATDGTACDDKGMVYTVGKVELDGSHVSEVKADYEPGNTSWFISLDLDPEGTKLFGQLTAGLAKQDPPANQLAILVHGQVVTAPTVQSAIPGGKIQISGAYTREAAEALAKKITG
ncbi:SecDF P1 head subdomain-containing protein [Kribbella sp. WER1]